MADTCPSCPQLSLIEKIQSYKALHDQSPHIFSQSLLHTLSFDNIPIFTMLIYASVALFFPHRQPEMLFLDFFIQSAFNIHQGSTEYSLPPGCLPCIHGIKIVTN